MGARRSLLAGTAVVAGAIACWLVMPREPDPVATRDGAAPAAPVQSRAAPRVPRTSPRVRASRSAPQDAGDAKDDDLARARALREAVLTAAKEDRWNDALKGLNELDAKFKDATREAIEFDGLEALVIAGRNRWFTERIGPAVFAKMDEFVAPKVRDSTLADARQWANRELPAQLWEKTGSDLALTAAELELFWKRRRVPEPRTAGYGGGTFVVLAPRSDATDLAAAAAAEEAKRLADEAWWSAAGASERGAFLTAYYVETSGYFAIVRADNVDCDACHGRSCFERTAPDGSVTRVPCKTCNGCGKVRTVTYR